MAETAFMTQYKAEHIAGFERGITPLRSACVTEADMKGNQAVFLVADSGDAEAVTRGVNGLIPARSDNLQQLTATLAEWHDLVHRTGFNVMSSQGNARRIMQETTNKTMHRKIDADIIAQLDTATNEAGSSAQTGSLALVMHAVAILGNNDVPVEEEDNMFGLISPAFQAYLMQVKEFASSEYVEVKPFGGPARKYRRWAGINFMVHSGLTGNASADEQCFIFHRNAIGHAVNVGEMQVFASYDEEQDYSWARATAYMGSKLLQNSGVVMMHHDGSGYVAT